MNRIGILTSGGDAPGMNACIRAVVRYALSFDMKVFGIRRGYIGLINGDYYDMNSRSVSDIIQRGGTILKTARCPEFNQDKYMAKAAQFLKDEKIGGLIVIGGDGSFRGAKDLADKFGVKTIGIPGTIDNDLAYTDYTLGFDTAVNTVLSAINNLRDTMTSHDLASIIEVMGRHCGDIALYAGLAGGAETILIPEKAPINYAEICDEIKANQRRGKMSDIIVLAEGAGNAEELMQTLTKETGIQIRITRLGHIQRGGMPTMADRVLAARFAVRAVDLLRQDKGSLAVGIKNNAVFAESFENIFKQKSKVDEELYKIAAILSQ